MGCSSIGYFFLGLFLLIWLINEPSGWFFVLFVVLVVGVIIFAAQKVMEISLPALWKRYLPIGLAAPIPLSST